MMRERILVIKLSALGDFILAMGAMEAVRRHHPDAHITLLTTKLFVDMAQRSGYFDEVWTDERPKALQPLKWARLARRLNGGNFTRVYDLQMNDRTRCYRALVMARPAWCGAPAHRGAEWKSLHAFERHRRALRAAGVDMGLPDLSWMESDVSLIAPRAPYILLIPGSAPRHPQKRWPAARYAAAAKKLEREGYAVAALGTAAEAGVIAQIRAACPGVADLSGKTSFYDIATLARSAAGAIGNDTGPTHLVSLAGCPVVALFSGSSHPELSAPVGPCVSVIQSDHIADIQVDEVLKLLRPSEMPADTDENTRILRPPRR